MQYRTPSSLATNRRSLQMTGAKRTGPSVNRTQRVFPESASIATTLSSAELPK